MGMAFNSKEHALAKTGNKPLIECGIQSTGFIDVVEKTMTEECIWWNYSHNNKQVIILWMAGFFREHDISSSHCSSWRCCYE